MISDTTLETNVLDFRMHLLNEIRELQTILDSSDPTTDYDRIEYQKNIVRRGTLTRLYITFDKTMRRSK